MQACYCLHVGSIVKKRIVSCEVAKSVRKSNFERYICNLSYIDPVDYQLDELRRRYKFSKSLY